MRPKLGYLRSRGHDVMVLRVLDPAEVDFTFAAPGMFHDLESGRDLYIDPQAARGEYQRRFNEHAAELNQRVHRPRRRLRPAHNRSAAGARAFRFAASAAAARAATLAACTSATEGRRMSLLTPLYVLGLAVISLPIIFHLIRRMPRGDFQFSSLMFLSPSPPRLTRRSRLENILLLLLRGAVLSLLAFAFARPFLRQQVPPGPTDADQRRVAIVVDTSASMRRGDLWQQATTMVDKVVGECRPQDQIALFACDDALRPLASFEDLSRVTPAQRQAVVSGRIRSAKPTWAGTSLGRGLMDAVEIVNNVGEATERQNRIARRVVLISDMQQGSRLNALSDYPWPEDVELDLRPVRLAQTTNAGLHRLADQQVAGTEAVAGELRVRVSNDEDSTSDEFQLQWIDEADKPVDNPISVYVPADESRVVACPATKKRLH